MRDNVIEGIITERDELRAVARGLVPWSTVVSDCMTANPVTATTTTTSDTALTMMLGSVYRHLPVVDEGELVGIVSLRDLVATSGPGSDAS